MTQSRFTIRTPSDFTVERARPATEQEREAVREREVTRKAEVLAMGPIWRCGYCDVRMRSMWRYESNTLADVKKHIEAK